MIRIWEKLGETAGTPEGCTAIQQAILRFSRGKCRVLCLERNSYRLNADFLGRSSVEKVLGVLVDNRLAMKQQCALVCKKATRVSWDASKRELSAD